MKAILIMLCIPAVLYELIYNTAMLIVIAAESDGAYENRENFLKQFKKEFNERESDTSVLRFFLNTLHGLSCMVITATILHFSNV